MTMNKVVFESLWWFLFPRAQTKEIPMACRSSIIPADFCTLSLRDEHCTRLKQCARVFYLMFMKRCALLITLGICGARGHGFPAVLYPVYLNYAVNFIFWPVLAMPCVVSKHSYIVKMQTIFFPNKIVEYELHKYMPFLAN